MPARDSWPQNPGLARAARSSAHGPLKAVWGTVGFFADGRTGGRGGRRPAGSAALELAACQDAGVTEQRMDFVVRNGTIVTPGHQEQADVGIAGGRIAQIGGTM